MDIVIYGIGALGCLFGSRLAGHESVKSLYLIGRWSDQIDAVRQKGLHVTHLDGNVTKHSLDIYRTSDTIKPADICLLLVKSYQTETAVKVIRYLLKDSGICLTLQNGLGNSELLAATIGTSRVVTGATFQAARVDKPGYIIHTGTGGTFISHQSVPNKTIESFLNLLCDAGLPVEFTYSIQEVVWTKLAINAAVNPLTGLLKIKNGELPHHPNIIFLMHLILEEVAAVAREEKVILDPETLKRKLLEVCQATAANKSSMLQDIQNHRRTEIDAISGEVVHRGGKHHVPTPVNHFMFQKITSNPHMKYEPERLFQDWKAYASIK